MKLTTCLPLLVCAAILAARQSAVAEDAFYEIPLASLKLTEGTLPAKAAPGGSWRWRTWAPESPYAVLDGPGEVYVVGEDLAPWEAPSRTPRPPSLDIRAEKGAEITGRLFVPVPGTNMYSRLRFKVSAAQAKPAARDAFFKAKEGHYRDLQDRDLPGAAWFRHQVHEAAKNHGAGTNAEANARAMMARNRWNETELEDTYDLFTGGRALSENLQLDRMLMTTRTNEELVAITNLPGITVKEMDWQALIKDAKPDLDPLAAFIPGDQHAVFFPSFEAMTQVIDEADANGTPVLEQFEPRSESAESRNRYQKQLCLGLSDLSRLLGPQVIASVAFTGSDPFLRVGTDVAVLFEARNPDLLKGFLAAQQKAALAANPDAKAVSGDVGGVSFTGLVAPDRSVCSYMASVSNVVFVSNSKSQLSNLVRVAKGGAESLGAQPEYIYFRSRYLRGDKSESAFVVLTDATIRRWCGPRWRIADSRRTRAAAVLAELQAAHLAELAAGKAADAALSPGFYLPGAGDYRLTRSGVLSSGYGSLGFMTPILEIPLDQVTRAEADAYESWNEGYQANWRQFFDPIALRFSVAKDRLGAELTIMPLIAGTEYREVIDFTSGAAIAATAGDPHANTLLHLAFAINTQSRSVQSAGNFLGNMAPGLKASPFGWMGQSIALYADQDGFWNRLVQSTNVEDYFEHNFPSLPLALHCEVKNPLGLAAFLTGLHAFVDQTAPGMTTWNNQTYSGQPYVQITAKSPDPTDEIKEYAIYYAATPKALIVTLNEALLKRALDRQAARATPDGAEAKKLPAIDPWLGKNICARADREFFDVLQKLTEEDYQTHLQSLAWNNLPILNEWKRLYPAKDPVAFHEQIWGTKLICPGGGTYVWNDKWQTMESTVFGHPAEPKLSPGKALTEMLGAQLGVTFENQGLSAKAVLNRKAKN